MSVSEVKLEIIQRILGLSDTDLANQIQKIPALTSVKDEVYILSSSGRKAIEAGLEDKKARRVYSSQEANGLLRKCQISNFPVNYTKNLSKFNRKKKVHCQRCDLLQPGHHL